MAIKEKGIRVDRKRMEAYLDGKELDIFPMEFKVLEALLMADGMVCTVAYLAEQTGGCENYAAITQQISRLRRHLGKRIETVVGHGFKIRRDHHS